MARLLIPFLMALAATPAVAEETQVNPYLDRSPAELRRQIADASAALEERWYQIDLIIFARNNPPGGEYWRLDQYPEFPGNGIQLGKRTTEESADNGADAAQPEQWQDQTEQQGEQDRPLTQPRLPDEADRIDRHAAVFGAWQSLDPSLSELADALQRLQRQGGFRILYSDSWQQPVREQQRALPVYIEGGRELPLPMPEFISFDQQDGLEQESQALTFSAPQIRDPNRPALLIAAGEPELRGTLRFSLARFLHVQPNLWFTTENDLGERYHVPVQQSRRMRSEETHYIDHPLFGIVVRITPWEHPEQTSLKQKKEALEQQAQ